MRGKNEFLDNAVKRSKEHSKSLRIGIGCGIVFGYVLGILTPKAVDEVKMWNYQPEKGNIPAESIEGPFAEDLDGNGKQETLVDITGKDGISRLYSVEIDANGNPFFNYRACGHDISKPYEECR
ncbi:MAG TPA: hypothetical protein HA362_01855 [Nanoarchaeota archaeon]|nr:hypothetical protein [Nanoarchaeota archaeon]